MDDNTAIRSTIKALLQEVESEFCECDDGSKALEMYRRHRPHWVLMDVRMREVDGITATQHIKAAFPDARIIMISNYSDTILRKQAHEAGVVAYVLKDDLSQLLNIILKTPGVYDPVGEQA